MTRVAHVMAGAAHGGAELFYERLCVALHDAGEAVLAVIRRDAARAARLRAAGLEVVELRFGGLLDRRTTPDLRQVLTRFAPEVVVSWMSRASAHLPGGPWAAVGRLGGYYDLRHYRACDHLVGNTHAIVDWLRAQGWAATRTHYLPNFSRDLAGAAPAPDVAREPPPVLLGLGRLHTDKGFDTLIGALPLLPEARVLIAGAGPERRRLERLAARLGVADRTRLLGWRQDVPELFAACDVFVCSSRVEPLGNMILEAWSAGRPVVAVAAAGPRELVRSGEDGLLVPLEDPTSLATAISSVVRDRALRTRLVAAGRVRFSVEFNADAVVARWRAFLAGIASQSTAGAVSGRRGPCPTT